MKALEIFRSKNMEQKPKQTKSSKSLNSFIKNAIINNGDDYESICRRMDTVFEFYKAIKNSDINFNFSAILDAYEDFFVGSDKIKKVIFSEDGTCALYEKQGDEKRRIWSMRGVSVTKDENANGSLLYFGYRKNWADFHKQDTGLLFAKEGIIFHHEGMTRYGEIPLWGSGSHIDFRFNEQDRLTSVTFKTMTEPRLGFWGKPTTINFDCGHFITKESYTDNRLEKSSNNERIL